MTLERLWNGWRAEYVGGQVAAQSRRPAESGSDGETSARSIFSEILASGLDDTETHIVHRGERCFAIMNAFPYTSGHLMVLPCREVAELEELTGDEATELWATVTDAVRVLKRVYRPEGLNVGVNLGRPAGGSISEHLHVHVVPRWIGDSNFMTAVAETRTLPEALSDSAEKIRVAWRDLPPA